ncbi:hypothetical protein HHK36_016018 [Tetracentron sinense]|uniref:Uncharacterized protein n=1 Tax=Tetracentron sinense TaxID=13715 RepID=A0A835DBJ9_TETSI|nr:hypothetical protein HHK36_016018 [Tetracentron sinense]
MHPRFPSTAETMKDRLGSGSVLDTSFVNPKLRGGKRSGTELGGHSEFSTKRVKMRDLELLFRSEGIETHNSEFSIRKEVMNQFHLGEKEEMSQIIEEPVTMIQDAVQGVRTGRNGLSLLEDAAILSLGHADSATRPVDLNTKAHISNSLVRDAAPTRIDEYSKLFLLEKHDKHHDLNFVRSRGIGLDLNVEDVSSLVEQDPFYPFKLHGHVKSREVSECGSSTGPLEENDSLRVWKEMKKNGFLSSSHGGIPMPKPRGRKSKNDVLKKKMERAKREEVNRFTKIAAPSGLLNELNPGIINHVRNSKQVYSILEALVKSEKFESGHIQSKQTSQLKKVTKEISDRKKELGNMDDSGASQLNLCNEDEPLNMLSGSRQTRVYPMSLNRPIFPLHSKHKGGASDSGKGERRVHGEDSGASHFTSDREDDTVTMKLSSSITLQSKNTSSISNEESANQASVSSLSVKAATVASQWLELLCQDIGGRLAALRRSKKRVRAVIQTELPFLMSKEFSSNQENDPYNNQSIVAGCPDTVTPDMHRVRWTALFDQMDKALSEEGKHLETWLNQVKEMKLHCEQSLQCVNWNAVHGLQQLGISENDSRSKKADNAERELAIRAAAASIYSTCNFVMSAENVSCF